MLLTLHSRDAQAAPGGGIWLWALPRDVIPPSGSAVIGVDSFHMAVNDLRAPETPATVTFAGVPVQLPPLQEARPEDIAVWLSKNIAGLRALYNRGANRFAFEGAGQLEPCLELGVTAPLVLTAGVYSNAQRPPDFAPVTTLLVRSNLTDTSFESAPGARVGRGNVLAVVPVSPTEAVAWSSPVPIGHFIDRAFPSVVAVSLGDVRGRRVSTEAGFTLVLRVSPAR